MFLSTQHLLSMFRNFSLLSLYISRYTVLQSSQLIVYIWLKHDIYLVNKNLFWRAFVFLRISTVINIPSRTQWFLIKETRMLYKATLFIYWLYTVLFYSCCFYMSHLKIIICFNIRKQSVLCPFELYFKSMNAFRLQACDFHILSACFFWIELMNYIYVGPLLFIILTAIVTII